jgi:hypothetical protein
VANFLDAFARAFIDASFVPLPLRASARRARTRARIFSAAAMDP